MELEKLRQKLKAGYERINRMQRFVSKVDVCKATLQMKRDEINDQITNMTTELCQQLQNFHQEIEQALTKTVKDRLSKLDTMKNRIHSANAHLIQVCMDAEGLLKGRSEDLFGRAVQKVYSRFEETWQELDYEEEISFENMTGIDFYSNAQEFLTKTYLATLSEVDKCGVVLSKQVFWVKSMQSDAPSQKKSTSDNSEMGKQVFLGKSMQSDPPSKKKSTSDNLEKAVKSRTSLTFGEADDILKNIPDFSKDRDPHERQCFGATKNLPSCVRIRAVDLCPEEVNITNGDSEEIKKVISVVTVDSRFSPNIPEDKCGEYMVGEGYKKLQKSSSSEGWKCCEKKKSHTSSDDSSINSFIYFPEQSETDCTVDVSNTSSPKSNKAVNSFAMLSPESALNVSSDPKPTDMCHTDLQIFDSCELEEDFVWDSEEDEFSDKRLMGLEESSFSNDANCQGEPADENSDGFELQAMKSCDNASIDHNMQNYADIPKSRPVPGPHGDLEIGRSLQGTAIYRNVALTNLGTVQQSSCQVSKPCSADEQISMENMKKLPALAPDINIFVGCSATASEELKESQEQEHDSVSKGTLASKVVVVSGPQSDALSSSFPRSIDISCIRLDIRLHMVHVGKGYFEVYAKCVKKIWDSFYFPIGVCTNSTGAVIVADTGNNRIKIYQNGHITNSFGQGLNRPSAVVINKKDEIFVKDDCCIHHFDPQGNFIKTIGNKKMHMPYGLGMTHDAQLVVLDTLWQNPRILIFTEDGQMSSDSYQPLLNPPPRSKCRFLAVHQGEVLTSDLGSSRLYLTSLKGELHKILGCEGSGPGELFEPSGIACDDAGNWIVADSKNDRIQAFAPNGYYLCKIQLSEPIRRPSGIHLTEEGHLYIINYLDGIIKVFKLG